MLRVWRHVTATMIFIVVMCYLNVVFALDGKRLWNGYEHWRLFYFLWVYPGVIPRTLWSWVFYLRPGFHPWDSDSTELIKHWSNEMAQTIAK